MFRGEVEDSFQDIIQKSTYLKPRIHQSADFFPSTFQARVLLQRLVQVSYSQHITKTIKSKVKQQLPSET